MTNVCLINQWRMIIIISYNRLIKVPESGAKEEEEEAEEAEEEGKVPLK